MIVYARLEEVLALLFRGRLVPIAPAKPGNTARLRDESLELIREFGIEISVSLKSTIIAVDVVDVELGVLSPLDVGLEESMIVFHITLAQRNSFADESRKASARSATRRVCLGPDSVPA